MTSIKGGCKGVLELEVETKGEERKEGSSPKSSIATKGPMHCMIMTHLEKYLEMKGPSCV
jgi:hypothetical protein